MDFRAVNKSLTIPAGSTQAPVNISILDDNILENTERFAVKIETIRGVTPASVITVAPNPTKFDITDNDGK